MTAKRKSDFPPLAFVCLNSTNFQQSMRKSPREQNRPPYRLRQIKMGFFCFFFVKTKFVDFLTVLARNLRR